MDSCNKVEYLVFKVSIAGTTIDELIDCGANSAYASARISQRTKISENALLDHTELDKTSYDTRLLWMIER